MAHTRDFASAEKASLSHETDTHSQQGHNHDTTNASSIDEKPPPEEFDDADATPTSRPGRHSRARSRASSVSSADTDPLEPLELALSGMGHIPVARMRTGATAQTSTSTWSRPPDFEVTFDSEELDPSNPREWPLWYRMWTIFVVSYGTWAIVLYSTSYTATMTGLEEEFDEPSQTIATLGVTTYLLGLATGSLVCAPLSELFGRRPLYLICLTISALLIIPCAMATSLAQIIVVRFFGALFGSVMVTNGAGTIADISTEDNRALYMSLWSIAPLNGPVTGPLIGGFVFEYLGWRWDNWLVLILTGGAAVLATTVKETYAPAILKQKAAKRRKDEDDERYWCLYEDSKRSVWELVRLNLSRPFALAFKEPILWFFNIWISVIYGILYLCFVAYPIVFEQHRGWTPGVTGLSFVGIGVGTMIAIFMEPVWRKIINSHAKDPETGRVAPEASAAIMSLEAVLTPIGQLVFSWTCLPTSIHYAIPIAFGIPFGLGNTLCFIYGTNYLAGAYGFYAASALSGNAVMRSIFGACLPLAGPTMYAKLTPQWAGTLLGLMEVILVPIPFVFYKYGDRIRAKSPVIKEMREEQAKQDRKRAKLLAKQQKQQQQQQQQQQEANKGVVAVDGEEEVKGEEANGRDVEKGSQ